MEYLKNAQDCHAENPETFHVPPKEDLATIKPGDFVKLIFDVKGVPHIKGERMWVHVTRVSKGKIEGTLDNNPMYVDYVDFGAKITFTKDHVIQIHKRQEH